MGKYLGCIDFSKPPYCNFMPIAEIGENFEVKELSFQEVKALLPDSTSGQINLAYNPDYSDELDTMTGMFYDKGLTVFEFEISDLASNWDNYRKTIRPVGYKVESMQMINSGKIRSIDTEGFYYIIPNEDIISDFVNDDVVEISIPSINTNALVFVRYDDMWAGPYEVGYRDVTRSYYIKPKVKGNKYIIHGYKDEDVKIININTYNAHNGYQENWGSVLVIKNPQKIIIKDVITDEVLVDNLRTCLQTTNANDGNISQENISTILLRNKESYFAGAPLTEEIRQNRLKRVQDFFSSNSDLEATVKKIADFIFPLIIKNKDNKYVNELIHNLIRTHPDLLENVKELRAIQDRIDTSVQILNDVSADREKLEKDVEALRKAKEELPKIDEAKNAAILQKDEEYKKVQAQLAEAQQKWGVYKSISDLKEKEEDSKREVDYLNRHKTHLDNAIKDLRRKFETLLEDARNKMVGVAFDGYITNKMMRAAAEWEEKDNAQQNEMLLDKIKDLDVQDKSREEIIDYICRTIHLVRPAYSQNTIVNIAICLTQGFLTVFSGEPGCGKTSICNIFSDVLGLNKIVDYINYPDGLANGIKRYIAVSVERGWTSKRDFVGYFNPLSKTFDKSNRKVYDALCQLDTEKRNNINKFPFIILLDEANLSPMEYYWSDFMNVCDDLGTQSNVNLGENYVFGIPETLHFVATINNDHTTETLSPRLLDRASIILLPYQSSIPVTDKTIPSEQIELITWTSLAKAFIPENKSCVLTGEIQKIYGEIIEKLRAQRIAVSPRVDRAIKQYWTVASKCFVEDELKTDPETVALDYAIAQRILPKIMGNGESFKIWLEELRSICTKYGLNMSAKILKDILEHGNDQMMYYQFFF